MAELTLRTDALPAPEPIAQQSRPANVVSRREWLPSPLSPVIAPAIDPQTLEVEWVSDPQALQQLEPVWQDLADDAVEPNPFFEPWMVLPALAHLPGPAPRFALVWAAKPGGRKGERLLCGLLPVTERALETRLGGARVLTFWKHPFCYLTAPLLRRGVARETLRVLLGSLARPGTLLRYVELPAEGPLAQVWTDVLRELDWKSWQTETFTRAFFRPAPDAERFLSSSVNGKRRKEWRRLTARLQELGRVEFDELETVEALRAWTAEFLALEAAGWKGREGVALEALQGGNRFFEELCRHAALRGRLQLLALRLDGRPLALKLNLFGAAGAGFAFKITFDEAYAKYSPGVLLELENIERLHARLDVQWMDSCAAPNRFMINQLWPERRALQSGFVAPPDPLSSLAVSALPMVRWARAQTRRLQGFLAERRAKHAAQ